MELTIANEPQHMVLVSNSRSAERLKAYELRVEKSMSFAQVAAEMAITPYEARQLVEEIEHDLEAEYADRAEQVRATQAARLESMQARALDEFDRQRAAGERPDPSLLREARAAQSAISALYGIAKNVPTTAPQVTNQILMLGMEHHTVEETERLTQAAIARIAGAAVPEVAG